MIAEEALVERACSGDGAAFGELVEPYRRQLHLHCYRMLGSFDDADDALQEALLAAWRGLANFRATASVRTWLYRVATNTCLNLVRTASRRPQMAEPLPANAPLPTGSNDVCWLQPYPNALLDSLPDDAMGPDARVLQNEAVSLAFVTALQLLSPRARAVLILRDVLGFSAHEVAGTLDSSDEAVAMTLSRARASLREKSRVPEWPQPWAGTAAADMLVQRLTAALMAHDVNAVVSLLAEDVRIAMPPLAAVWHGRERAAEFLLEVAFRLVPEARFIETRANMQPALAVYTHDAVNEVWRVSGLLVITVRGSQIAALTPFESNTVRPFGLPRILPGDDPSRDAVADITR